MWQWSMQFCGLEGKLDACISLATWCSVYDKRTSTATMWSHSYNQLWSLLYNRESNVNLWKADLSEERNGELV